MISCIIPVYEGEKESYIASCLESLVLSSSKCTEEVEIYFIYNPPNVGRVKAKNIGATLSKGETLVFLDVDCLVGSNFLCEVSQKSKNPLFVGGGVKWVKLSRKSLGLCLFYALLGFYLFLRRITVGAFWVKRDVFFSLNGFSENSKYDDIDFATRLKRYAKAHKRKFESIKLSNITWSTRKFDAYGDWHWVRGYKTEELMN